MTKDIEKDVFSDRQRISKFSVSKGTLYRMKKKYLICLGENKDETITKPYESLNNLTYSSFLALRQNAVPIGGKTQQLLALKCANELRMKDFKPPMDGCIDLKKEMIYV